ncbi:guanine nucleotide binding protein, alpha subunit [Globomyces pollinis-pini]|nr:guanine nucleotide binding protein, alpha subunit [Globomyces pollinis-pini]
MEENHTLKPTKDDGRALGRTKSFSSAVKNAVGSRIRSGTIHKDQQPLDPEKYPQLPTQPETDKSKQIEQYLKEEKKKQIESSDQIKLLILGTSNSGKSTFLKQLKLLYGNGFTEKELTQAKHSAILSLLTMSCDILIRCPEDYRLKHQELFHFSENEPGPYVALPFLVIKSIKTLWKDPVFQTEFETLKSDLPNSAVYFFDKVSDIGNPNYVLSNEDVLLLRTVTQSVSDTVLTIDNHVMHFYDVSGLKHHRKQWITYFDDVISIVFVVDISSYDKTMAEDPDMNQMVDALQLFDSIVNNPTLAKPAMILFFNKKDIFEQKIKKVPLSKYFTDFKGPDYQTVDGLNYFRDTFTNLIHNKKKVLSVHLTCCTDSKAMSAIVTHVM